MRKVRQYSEEFKLEAVKFVTDEGLSCASVGRRFGITTPNRIWCGDITYLRTKEGFLYLAVVLDLFSRRVVGWALSDSLEADFVVDALSMAIFRRKPDRGLIFHSDRGTQYACLGYQTLLKKHGIIASMSRKGNCWDNAVMERFFRSLKSERMNHGRYETKEAAGKDAVDYIEMFYNRKRLHSYLDYKTPVEYEMKKIRCVDMYVFTRPLQNVVAGG